MPVKDGNTVKVHYKGTLDDGSVFDSSEGKAPLDFKIGEGKIIPGFEKGVLGMEKGEKKTIKIPCGEAYGPIRPEAMADIPQKDLPEDMKPEVGQMLQMGKEDGQMFIAQVIKVTEDKITIDANHPLAGKDLTFELEVVEIKT